MFIKRFFSFTVILFLFAAPFLFADPDYRGGNGTIVSRTEDDEMIVTVRKYETEPFKAGGMLRSVDPVLYDDYLSRNKIADFHYSDNRISILQVCEIVYPKKLNKRNSPIGELWFKISTGGQTGWIWYYKNSTGDLYKDDVGEYLEVIQSGGKAWNARRLEQYVAVYENLNVRDAPGLAGKKVYLIQMDDEHYYRSFNTLAVTAETETIDGLTDHWVKIEYEKGKYGWVFGGYVGVERGGPKFELPEYEIDFYFGEEP